MQLMPAETCEVELLVLPLRAGRARLPHVSIKWLREGTALLQEDGAHNGHAFVYPCGLHQ